MRTLDCKGDAKLVSMPSQTTLNLDDVTSIFSDYLLRFMNTRVHVRKSGIFVSIFIHIMIP